MREVQTRLRILSETKDGTVCPDSDLFPFLKELIALDKSITKTGTLTTPTTLSPVFRQWPWTLASRARKTSASST